MTRCTKIFSFVARCWETLRAVVLLFLFMILLTDWVPLLSSGSTHLPKFCESNFVVESLLETWLIHKPAVQPLKFLYLQFLLWYYLHVSSHILSLLLLSSPSSCTPCSPISPFPLVLTLSLPLIFFLTSMFFMLYLSLLTSLSLIFSALFPSFSHVTLSFYHLLSSLHFDLSKMLSLKMVRVERGKSKKESRMALSTLKTTE